MNTPENNVVRQLPGNIQKPVGYHVHNGIDSPLLPSTLQMISGAPSGTPRNGNNVLYDITNNKLWIYNGAWKSVTLT